MFGMLDYNDIHIWMPPKNRSKKQPRGTVVGCAVCGKTHVTLLAREGERFCKKCYAGLLALRALEEGESDA